MNTRQAVLYWAVLIGLFALECRVVRVVHFTPKATELIASYSSEPMNKTTAFWNSTAVSETQRSIELPNSVWLGLGTLAFVMFVYSFTKPKG